MRYRYLFTLFCFIASFVQAQNLRFAVLTDIHLVPNNANDSVFPQIVNEIQARNPSFVIVLGDLTNQGNNVELQNAHRQLSTFHIPVHVIPGNHETTWSESACLYFPKLFGNDRFCFMQDAFLFCGISTGPYMRMSDGLVKAEDLLWLQEILNTPEAQGKTVVFCCHYPMREGLSNYESLTSILNHRGVAMAFCGHEHRLHLYNCDSIPQMVCPALRSRENEVGYTIVEMDKDKASCHYFKLGEDVASQTKNVDYKTRHCLNELEKSPIPERIGGFLPRGWHGRIWQKEDASLLTGLAVKDGLVCYGNSQGALICRDEESSQLKWKYETGSALYSTPLIHNGLVIIGTTQNQIVALNSQTGEKIWHVDTSSPVTGDGVIDRDALYMGCIGHMMRIDTKSGHIDWTFDGIRSNGRPQGAPAVGERQLVFGAWDTNLYCLDKQNGRLIWKWNNGKSVDLFSPGNVVPVIAGNRVLIVAPDRYLTILDLNHGRVLYRTNQYKVRESLGYDPVSRRAFAKTMNGELLSLQFPADSLQLPILTDLGIGYEHTPCLPLIANGIVYSGSRKGEVVATSAKDNRLLWRVKCGNSSIERFQSTSDGQVLVNLAEGVIWKFGYENPAFISRLDQPDYKKALSGKHIALWPSHGYYYNQNQQRWMWQRARCFGSVEDISILSYVQPFLIPMLEHAGAYVMMPRERDIQTQEVIVDADRSSGTSSIQYSKGVKWNKKKKGGFKLMSVIQNRENPFEQGSHIEADLASAKKPVSLTYIPEIPQNGYYAVYVSYSKSSQPITALYEVCHSGGVDRFLIDQSKGEGLFHYLGTFYFRQGKKQAQSSVKVMPSQAGQTGILSSDAIRFGGGLGTVARDADGQNPQRSGVPRYAEGARYFLQYCGVPDSVYSPEDFKDDYKDDYKCRGAWVNYLLKKHIPVDCALAFHTDAGITPNDSIIGTLAIYSTKKGSLQQVMSDTVSGTLSDMIQTQLTHDIKALCNPKWRRRRLMDKPYFEAWMPDVPTMLLELLSHQNLGDMRYGLDPRFRFIASRSIYKAMGRFISQLNGEEFVVQPLSPVSFSMQKIGQKRIRLNWEEQPDMLEPTAVASGYRLYIREEDEDWQKPILVNGNSYEWELPEFGRRYQFKVTAYNDGGESFDSEELSVCLFKDNKKPALLVNGFTRVGPPAFFDYGQQGGIAWWDDEGVPYGTEFAFVGYQYDFSRASKWLSDDAPGWGASGVEGWGKQFAGNTFNYPARHGTALQQHRCSYVSTSRKAFEKGAFRASDYALLDLIFGEERASKNFAVETDSLYRIYTPDMKMQIRRFAESRVPLLLSGAYIASETMNSKEDMQFVEKVLHFKPVGNHACRDGRFAPVLNSKIHQRLSKGTYNNRFSKDIYKVESPDGLSPSDKAGCTLYRYSENGLSAGVYYTGDSPMIVLGFPFETIGENNVKQEILDLLLNK